MELKTTPFTETHIALGAKMAEFAGFNMPINYANGINHEHMTVVNGVGVFDVSHMGEFMVTGPRAKEFLGRICSNNLKLIEGQAQYNCFPNGKGGIVDDLIVYHYNDEKYLLVVNAANIDKDWAWVNKNNAEGVTLENISDHVAQLAVQGPKAILALQKLTDVKLDEIKYYHFAVGTFAGCEDVIISATGYTGAGGFELYFNPAFGDKIWKAVFEAGAEFGIEPIGLGARDTLRLEMGFCLYGHEIDDETSPIEAGLGWITKPAEGKNLIDGDLFVQQRAEGTKKKLVGFEMQQDRAIPRKDYEVTDGQGNVIGVVTSGCMSPCRGIGVGMAHVKPEFSKLDTTIYIRIRNKEIPAMVVKMPFRH